MPDELGLDEIDLELAGEHLIRWMAANDPEAVRRGRMVAVDPDDDGEEEERARQNSQPVADLLPEVERQNEPRANPKPED